MVKLAALACCLAALIGACTGTGDSATTTVGDVLSAPPSTATTTTTVPTTTTSTTVATTIHLRCDCGGNYFGLTERTKKGRIYYRCSRNNYELGDERCGHRPRSMRALDLEAAVWEQVRTVLTDEDYLLDLAASYLSATDAEEDGGDRREAIEQRVEALDRQKVRIGRKLADSDELDTFETAIAEINAEKKALTAELDELDRRQRMRVDRGTVDDQLRNLVDTALERMTDPTIETMAELTEFRS